MTCYDMLFTGLLYCILLGVSGLSWIIITHSMETYQLASVVRWDRGIFMPQSSTKQNDS